MSHLMDPSSRVAVLGGGVAGVVVAAELARRGARVDLLERAPALGGLHRSVLADGLHFDIGAFKFGPRHEIVRAFPCLLGVLVRGASVERTITPAGHIDKYPVTVLGYLRDHGWANAIHDLGDLVVSRLRGGQPQSVPEYARRYVGQSLYVRSGLKSYVERLNGLPDHEIGWEFAEQRLAAIHNYGPLWRARRAIIRSYERMGPAPDAVLVRPAAGFPAVYGRIREELERLGVQVKTGHEVQRVERAGAGVGDFILESKVGAVRYAQVVSTIPIPVMFALVGASPSAEYRTRGLVSLFYRGRLRRCGETTELYNFTHQGMWKRIAVHSRQYGRAGGDDYFAVEVTVDRGTEATIRAARADFEDHLTGLGFLERGARCVGHTVTERAYPVFRVGDTPKLDADRAKLRDLGVHLVGRQGAFEYLSSHAVASKARRLATSVANAEP